MFESIFESHPQLASVFDQLGERFKNQIVSQIGIRAYWLYF